MTDEYMWVDVTEIAVGDTVVTDEGVAGVVRGYQRNRSTVEGKPDTIMILVDSTHCTRRAGYGIWRRKETV